MSAVLSAMPAPAANQSLADTLAANVGRHTDKTFDWDAFPANRDYPDLARAQMRYVGAGGSPKVNDSQTLKAAHFTFSLVHKPPRNFAAAHSHEVVEHFFIVDGVLTVGWVWGDEVVEAKLGRYDMILNKTGRPHGFRNDGVEPVLMQITVGSGTPEKPVYTCHPMNKPLDMARRFGAAEGKVMRLDPDSPDQHHRDMALHVARYRDRVPVREAAGFTRLPYIGEGGAPAQNYRLDLVHLPRNAGVRAYTRDVEDTYFCLEGSVIVGWEENGETVETRLAPRDIVFNPAGRPHYFRNDGLSDAVFSMAVGSGKPESVAFQAR